MSCMRSGELLFGGPLPALLVADEPGASNADGEEAAAFDCGDRRQRRGKNRVPGYAHGLAHAARECTAINGSWADVDLVAADHDDGPGNWLVSGKNGCGRRTLALGALSIQLPAAPTAVGDCNPGHFRR